MRAIALERFGGPETLQLVTLPDPVPQAGEVLVHIVAAGVNPVDWKIREGLLQQRVPHRFPLIPGWEMAGYVEANGPVPSGAAPRFQPGDAVWSYTRLPELHHGAYAERLALPASMIAAKPAAFFFHEAGAVPLAGLTAYQALLRPGDVKPGTSVLVHAAAGGVGHLAVQLAKSAGARVLGTAGKSNLDFVRSLGVDDVIDYTAGDFRDAVRAVCPDGVTVAFDTMGGDVLARSYDVVARGGRLVSIATPPDAAEGEKRGFRVQYVFVEPSASDLDALGALANAGRLRVHVSSVLPLSAVAEAHVKSREGRTRGKAVLMI